MEPLSVDAVSFDQLNDSVCNWGRWGPHDERGTLNHLTAERVTSAAKLVRTGRCVSLAHDLDTVAGPDNAKPALHYMTHQHGGGTTEPRMLTDFVGTDFHGKSVTHVDALCHCNFRGRLYNDQAPPDDDSTGSEVASIQQMSGGVVGRGVLLDVPRSQGVGWLEPGTAVMPEELGLALEGQGISPAPGDIVLVRTGHHRRRTALGAWDPSNHSAGLHPTVMAWLHDGQASVLGSDGDSDSRPSGVHGVEAPIHALALARMGMPLIDNMNLEDVAVACAQLGRWEFLFTLAPLRIPGGTGSPVNPLAVF